MKSLSSLTTGRSRIFRHRILRTVVPIPPTAWVVIGIVGILAVMSPNPGIGLFGAAIACWVAKLLWRSGEPQTLLFIVAFQWLQGFAPVLSSLLEGEPIAKWMGGAEFETATWMTLLGTGVFACGLKLATFREPPLDKGEIIRGLRALKRKHLFIAWVVLSILSTALAVIGIVLPALRQGLIAIEVWKWATVLLLFFRCLACGKGGAAAFFVLGVEVAVGIMGFFSAFKEVFFILLVAGTGVFALGKRKTGTILLVGSCLFVFLGFWQAVKVPYRLFLNRGEGSQTVQVSISERVSWLAGSIFEIKKENVEDVLEGGLRRLGYVEYFGHSLRSVPAVIPHTEGKLWKEAILHPLMPRLFFPNKPAINDSDRTNAYTGVRVADAEQGTSISIGYVGESYIDFGRWGMFVPILLLGWVIGWCYDFLRRKAPHPLLGISLGSCFLLSSVLYVESSNIKMIGGLAAAFLVTAMLMHFFGKPTWRWLTGPSSAKRRRSPRKLKRVGTANTVLKSHEG